MRGRLLRWLPMVAVLALLVAALWIAADAESAESRLGAAYGWLFGVCAAAVLVLVVAIARELWRLWRERAEARPGARLNARLAALFGLIALPPTLLVAGFALRFLDAGVDSWFRVDLEAAHEAARALGEQVLVGEQRQALARVEALARAIADDADADVQAQFDRLLEADSALAVHLASYDGNGGVEALAYSTTAITLPGAPDEALRLQIAESGGVAQSLTMTGQLVVRAFATATDRLGRRHLLQWIQPLPAELAPQLAELERSSIDYAQLRFQRGALKTTFALILGLVTLLALLATLLAALAATRRLTRPIARLAEATAAIGEGRFGTRIEVQSRDELGALTAAFNRMSRDLSELDAREQASRAETEQARAHLAAVLSRLSAGVVSVDGERVTMANAAAAQLLDCALDALIEQPLAAASAASPVAAQVMATIRERGQDARGEWREELALPGDPPRALLLRAVRLGGDGARQVVIIDDMSVIAQAQREAAWSEVARRLAHEIKNPLTPIQLAAERMRHRFQGKLDPGDTQVLERATQTIVAQVEALKGLVNAFGDYARPVRIELRPLAFAALVGEVLDLYESSGQCRIERDLAAALPPVRGDRERLRQLLINLLTNAVEAGGHGVAVEVKLVAGEGGVELGVRDHGPGLPAEFDGRWFEPYMSTKPKGGGLGLAMVQKIAEEHGGRIRAGNAEGGGARFVLWLPSAGAAA
ncbi:MAG: HAMP domain-containing protein [Xanthomonadales bacterium]|nr:HAMP domain-containing protein [Xanthomonadales bacterium]